MGVRSAALLAPSAYLASAAGTLDKVVSLLPSRLHAIADPSASVALRLWQAAAGTSITPPAAELSKLQRAWDDPCCRKIATALLDEAADSYDLARLRASQQQTSGAWLHALPLSSVGLKMMDDVVRVAIGVRLGLNLCEPHTCTCGQDVDARGTHGLACKKSAGRHPRHALLNDVVWRATQRAEVPSTKESNNLCFVGGAEVSEIRRPCDNPHLHPPRLRDVGFLGRACSTLRRRARAAHFGGHRRQP